MNRAEEFFTTFLRSALFYCDFQAAVQLFTMLDNDSVRKLLSLSEMQLWLHRPNLVGDTITASEIKVDERKQLISLIIGANPELLNEKDGNDRAPLLLSNIHPELIKHLISLGAHLEATDEDGKCLLHLAPKYLTPDQLHDLVCFIIQHCGRDRAQALYEMVTGKLETPLHCQVATMKAETLELVASSLEINLETQDAFGKTPLMRAIDAGRSVEFIKMLITRFSCDWTITDHDGWNVLHYAASRGHIEALCFLNGLPGYDINSKTVKGETPLQIFVEQGDNIEELFPKIVALGADPTLENKYGTSLYDIYFGDYNIKEMFAREKAEVNLIFEAVESNDLNSVISACEVYSRKGKIPRDIWRKYRKGVWTSPLHTAVKNGNLKIVQYLLEDEGFDMKVADDPAFSNIMWLAVKNTQNRQIKSIKYMVNILNGLNKNLVSRTGEELCNCRNGSRMYVHIELFIQLMELGIDLVEVHQGDHYGETLLYLAAHSFDLKEYGLLIQSMARLGKLKCLNPHYDGSICYLPLFRAMEFGRLDEEALQILCESEEVNLNYVTEDCVITNSVILNKFKSQFVVKHLFGYLRLMYIVS